MGDVSLMEPLGNLATSQSMQPYTGTWSSASVDLIFLLYLWDQNGHESNGTKQEADTTASLLPQQQPQMKVVEQKLSAASSDEERLAAGISMIGLQTKRLSGARHKRLTRERKMSEGTWTVEKPPGKTPSSQAKGVAKSSRDVKRPHSDSSTPSQYTWQNFYRQTV